MTNQLLFENLDDTISLTDVQKLVEREYKLKELKKKYNIKQGTGNDKRYYVMINGKRYRSTHLEDLLEMIMTLTGENTNHDSINGLYENWKLYRQTSRANGTFKKDIDYYNRFIKNSPIANIPITSLTIDDAYTWFDYCCSVKPDMKEKYFKNVKGCLNSFIIYAQQKKLINQNPFEYFDVHKDNFAPKTIHKDEDDIFSDKEKDAIKSIALKEKDNKSLAIVLLFNLGIRDGELLALKWRDVSNNTIHIQSEMVEICDKDGNHKGFKYVDHCKTVAGDRELLLNSEVQMVLRETRKYNMAKGFPISEDDYIFLRKRNGEIIPFTPRVVYSKLERLCKQANMSVIKSPHDIRRTVFTNLYYAGMPLKDIQKFAGHEDMAQTEKYIKYKPDIQISNYLEAII